MFGLWCSNPIIEATGKLDSNPIWYLKFYVFSRSSFLLILPHLLLTPLVPPPNLLVSPPITLPSLTSPIPITFYRPTSPDSEPLPHVGPEPVALNNRILSLQDVRLHHLQTHLPHFLLHHLLQGVNSQILSQIRRGFLSVGRQATLFWKLLRDRPMRGIITHVSNPKRRTIWTNTLENIFYIQMFTPPCHKILGILAHIFRTFLRFPTTRVQ